MATDLKNNLKFSVSLAPASRSDPAVPVDGTAVDRTGYDSAVVLVHVGTLTGSATPSLTMQIQDSDDNVTYAAVAAADLDGGVLPAIVAATDDTLYEIGYLGRKRYLRVSITAKGGTTPAVISDAVVVLGKPRVLPA